MTEAIEPSFLTIIRETLPSDRVLTSSADLTCHGYDATAGLKGRPVAVVLPQSTEEVQRVIRAAARTRTPIITRGSGTGLSGGTVPSEGSVVLSLVKMDQIQEVDTANLTLLAEAGARTITVEQAAEKHGLFYPPDPSSMKISTIGGNVANNSGGLRGLKYGVTRNYVMGMEVALPDGSVAWLGNKCVKDVSGYSLKDLFIGSEGTLGVITRVLLRLVPRPATRKTLVATFPNIEAAANTVSQIIAASIIPCTLEFLDQATIECVEAFAHVGLPVHAKAMLLMESDGHASVVSDETAQMERIALANDAIGVRVAADAEEAVRLATARRSAFSALARRRPTTILEDVTVPRSALAPMVRRVEEIARKYALEIANFGHMGDGNLHPTILTDERDSDAMRRVESAMHEIFAAAIELGGTITGEHGVGLAKKPFLSAQFHDASFDLLKALKRTIDPQNILNPGKIFDL